MNRNQLKAVLKINGFSEESSEEEIRLVLLSASYSEVEVERALVILREKNASQAIRADGLHTVFYTDSHLKPSEISGLLGIDIDVNLAGPTRRRSQKQVFGLLEGLLIIGLATAVAAMGIFFYMFIYDVGLFHPVIASS